MLSSKSLVSLPILLALGACGGGSGSDQKTAQTATGYFIDSPVSGLSYSSGSQSGVTAADGSFTYEVGQPVTFKLGSLVLGSITIDKNNRIFPVDLVSGARDETHSTVSLMARVLQSLDSDGNPENGITINASTRAAISSAIELANSDPATVINLIQNVIGTPLVSETAAKAHIQSNLIKEYAGTWTGSYTGDDHGPCSVSISTSGAISGTCTSQQYSGVVANLNGSVNSAGDYAAGSASTGANFTAIYQRSGDVSGDWVNGSLRGKFTLKRQTP